MKKSNKNNGPSLFEHETSHDANRPLADILRPQSLGEVMGQEHLLGKDGALTLIVQSGHLPSIILWGPPGCGKTTLARILAKTSGYHFETLSAVVGGVNDLRQIFSEAEVRLKDGVKTLLMVDEIHRFNRGQQDVFLPYIEDGTITLVGATTENPSFELNGALLSRCKVLVLKRLESGALEKILERAETYMKKPLPVTKEAREMLIAMSDGDGRYLINLAETIFAARPLPLQQAGKGVITPEELMKFAQKRMPLYDKHQDSHYNLISALHKSLRGSDPDAALYWFCRMIDGGEDPLYICRRLTNFAVEDVGMADPNAVHIALAAKDAYDFMGSPEGELAIAHAVTYLATAPKSNANYVAFKSATNEAKRSGSLMPPKHILNAPTKLMREEGYSKGYMYDHNAKGGFSGQDYFPEGYGHKDFYFPKEKGYEREIKARLDKWRVLRAGKGE